MLNIKNNKTMKYLYVLLFLLAGKLIFPQVSIDTAVDFTAKDPNGKTIQLFPILDNGQHVLIYFFSTTCYGCQEYAPCIDTIYDLYGQNEGELYVMAINKDADNAGVTAFANEFNWEFPYVSGTEGNGYYILHDLYGVGMTPTTVIIKPDRAIPWDIIYPASVDTLNKYLSYCGLFPVSDKEIISSKAELRLFPNPAAASVQILYGGNINRLTVFNALGREIYRKKNISNGHKINLTRWKKGIYFVKIETGQGTIVRKLIVR